MSPDEPRPHDLIEALRGRLGARAAGWWKVAGDQLEQVAFAAAPDLSAEAAADFTAATRSVALGQADLGIVRAVLSLKPAVTRAAETSPDFGSGLWLRRFGAERSVAVPVRDASGSVAGVVSVALGDGALVDGVVADLIRAVAATWQEA